MCETLQDTRVAWEMITHTFKDVIYPPDLHDFQNVERDPKRVTRIALFLCEQLRATNPPVSKGTSVPPESHQTEVQRVVAKVENFFQHKQNTAVKKELLENDTFTARITTLVSHGVLSSKEGTILLQNHQSAEEQLQGVLLILGSPTLNNLVRDVKDSNTRTRIIEALGQEDPKAALHSLLTHLENCDRAFYRIKLFLKYKLAKWSKWFSSQQSRCGTHWKTDIHVLRNIVALLNNTNK